MKNLLPRTGRSAFAILVAGCLVAAGGCSGRWGDKWRSLMPPTYPAAGTVTYRGKPLEGATVVFHPLEGVAKSRRAAAGVTNSAGRFVMTTLKPQDGVAAGGYQVTVEKTTTVVPGAVSMPPDEFGAFPLGADPSAAKPLIPEKYFSPATSGLSAEIKASGRNEFAFAIK